MKNILIVNGHPDTKSFNYALSKAYKEGALENEIKLEQINLADLKFDPILKYGYRKRMEHEPDLKDALEKIKKADHIVWFFPMWWYGTPALLKGFIDRTLLPGIAFEHQEGSPFPKKLLKGRSSRIVITSDTPRWYDYLFMKSPAINHFKKGVLEFCGIKPVKVTYIAPLRKSTNKFRTKWLKKLEVLGRKLS